MHLSSLKPSVKVKAAAVSVRRIQTVGYGFMQWSHWKEACKLNWKRTEPYVLEMPFLL